ncbi:hypothetical protein [Synechocystis sp. LKSZ1]|uniref:hypothetical protein n=1 Tax=Synechocystis sp. LKSZ1 TaxID=3144951 RepID=UPI00336C2B3D
MANPPRRCVSLIPNLMGGEGHIIPYHQAFSQAVMALGWIHEAWIPQQSPVDNLPQTWRPCLAPVDLEADGNLLSKALRLPQVWQLAHSIAQNLKALPTQEPTVLFLERFIHLQLLALVLALALLSPAQRANLSLWLLYRRDVHRDQTRGLYKRLNQALCRLLRPQNCIFLTDSESLGQSLQAYFQFPFTVLPIPHTDFPALELINLQTRPIYCWWPGSPRPEKGWEIIRRLGQTPTPWAADFCLVAAQSTQLTSVPQGVALELLPDHLSREDYGQWLQRSSIILIPYDLQAYRERTSGIFTEAVIAGRLPLVTEGTWMAQELRRYHLEELILQWHDPAQVWQQITLLLQKPGLLDAFSNMQQAYQHFHCLEYYTQVLGQLGPEH